VINASPAGLESRGRRRDALVAGSERREDLLRRVDGADAASCA